MAGDAAELRRGIGYVIQQAGLFPHRTILDNIATVPLLLGWSKAKARKRAAELMETVGLAPEMAKRYPTQLSGGQQQRVGVARALAADPPILLMDEPFSAVDPVVRESLQDELLRLQARAGQDDRVRHPRHRRGRQAGRQGRGAAGRAASSPSTTSRAHLLARPVDDFVDNFVGRDRGYRGLGFLSSAALTARRAAHGRARRARLPADAGWVLVVDADGRPQGWLNGGRAAAGGHRRHRAPRARRLALRRGLRLAAQRARRRAVLAVRASGVAVDGDGRGRGRRSAPTTCCACSTTPAATTRPEAAHDLGARQPRPHRGAARCSTSASPFPVVVGLVLAIPLGWLANRNTAAPQHAAQRLGAALHGPVAGAVRAAAAGFWAPASSTRST